MNPNPTPKLAHYGPKTSKMTPKIGKIQMSGLKEIDRQPNQYHSKLCFSVYQTIATANALNGRPQNNLSSKEWAKFGVGVWFDNCFGVYLCS